MYGYAFSEGIAMDFSQFFQKRPRLSAETLPFSALLPSGLGALPMGKLIEMRGKHGGGKTEALALFLKENPSLQIAWIEVGSNAYPCGFSERGVELSRVLFIEAANSQEALWCAHQVLKSQIFGAVVLSQLDHEIQTQVPPHTTQRPRPRDSRITESRGLRSGSVMGEIELRRLQIAAGKSGSMVFLLNEKAITAESWPIEVQLEISRPHGSEIQIQILKARRDTWMPEVRNIG
jgi:hypothetical protein